MHQMYLSVKIDGATQAENETAGVAAMAVFEKEGISAWNAAGGVSARDRYQVTASGEVTGISDEDWRAAEVWDRAEMAAIKSFRIGRGLSEADDQARRYDMGIAGPYDDLVEQLRKLSWKLPDAWKVMGNAPSALHYGDPDREALETLIAGIKSEAAAGRQDNADLLMRAKEALTEVIAANEQVELPLDVQ
jgi:hypothetical protein